MGNDSVLRVVSIAVAAWLFLIYPFEARCDEARDLYKQGVTLFEAERYEEAAASFRKAHAIKPTWKLRYNIGQSEAAAGKYGLALESFEAYLVEGADQVPEDRSEEVLKELKRLRVIVGVIQVEAPKGVELIVDKMSRGSTPFDGPVRVSAGKHHVILKQNGIIELDRTISVAGGMTTTLKLEKEPEPTHPGTAPAGVTPPKPKKKEKVDPPPVEEGPDKEPSTPMEEKKSGLSAVPFYSLLGVTGALAAGTVVMEVLVLKTKSEIQKNPSDKKARDRGKSLQLGEGILLGLTGAAAVTSIVLLFLTDFSKDKEAEASSQTASMVPWIMDGGAGIGLVRRF